MISFKKEMNQIKNEYEMKIKMIIYFLFMQSPFGEFLVFLKHVPSIKTKFKVSHNHNITLQEIIGKPRTGYL